MKLETFKTKTTEIFVTGNGVAVTVNPWSNHEGANFMIHSRDAGMAIRCAGSFRWEELDVLLVALNAARAA